MIPAQVGKLLTGVARQSVGAACGCVARSWNIAVERDLVGATLRAELRKR